MLHGFGIATIKHTCIHMCVYRVDKINIRKWSENILKKEILIKINN